MVAYEVFQVIFGGNSMVIITVNEGGLCFWEFNSIKLVVM